MNNSFDPILARRLEHVSGTVDFRGDNVLFLRQRQCGRGVNHDVNVLQGTVEKFPISHVAFAYGDSAGYIFKGKLGDIERCYGPTLLKQVPDQVDAKESRPTGNQASFRHKAQPSEEERVNERQLRRSRPELLAA